MHDVYESSAKISNLRDNKVDTQTCVKLLSVIISIENFLSFQIAATGVDDNMSCFFDRVNTTS
jgi:hypothetical protein